MWVAPMHGMLASTNALSMCSECMGLFGKEHRAQHETFHQSLMSREEAKAMSAVKWCDNGEHAFKAGVKGSQSGTMTIIDDDGMPQTVTIDACPEHSFQPTNAKKVEAIKSGSDNGHGEQPDRGLWQALDH